MSMLLAATLASQLYRQAIAAMSDLPQPASVTFRMQGQGDGLRVDLVTQNGNVWLNVRGGSAASDWTIAHRTHDYQSAILNDDGVRYTSARSFFDPTWYGASRALREGMFNSQDPAPPNPQATPAPAPSAANLKTISLISVIGPSLYDVDDRGPATCTNGDSGRALHLTSRTRDPRHQFSDVVVDTANMRFCSIRFSLGSGLGFHGYLEQHYGNVGGYWMQTGGLMDGTLRAFGIAFRHGIWRYRLTCMHFGDGAEAPGDELSARADCGSDSQL
jgi:hypothetical protein